MRSVRAAGGYQMPGLVSCKNCKWVCVFNEGTSLEAYQCGRTRKNLRDKIHVHCEKYVVKSKWVFKKKS